MRYRVEHRYASSTYGPWSEGDHVELNEDEAAWVNHDSEGTLKLVDPQEQAREKRERQEEQERRRAAEQAARDRREKAERIHGVSQADEPTRMDDLPDAQREQADREPAGLVKAPMEPTGGLGEEGDGRNADTTDLPPGGVPRPDDNTGTSTKSRTRKTDSTTTGTSADEDQDAPKKAPASRTRGGTGSAAKTGGTSGTSKSASPSSPRRSGSSGGTK